MKRMICLLLSGVLLLVCCGCAKKTPVQQDGIVFYYPNAQLTFQPGSSIYGSEVRSLATPDNWAQVLNIYFLGPEGEHLTSPFPSGLTVKKTIMTKDTIYITVSDHLTELSGLDMTIACSCLTLTAMALSGVERVVINAENALLDGQKKISMDKNNLLLSEDWQEE